MFRHFCRTLVIVKPSELTRTRREGGRGKGKGEEKVLNGCFLAMKLHIGVPGGEKCKTKAEKWRGEKNQPKKPTKNKKTTQGRVVGDREGGWGAPGTGGDRVPAPMPSERAAPFVSVTEWALAGQQTAICKHHEGKHQSTLDFFFFI